MFAGRIAPFLVDNEGALTVSISVDAHRTSTTTARDGHFETLLLLPDGQPGLRLVQAQGAETTAHLVGPNGLTIISDIDDTVTPRMAIATAPPSRGSIPACGRCSPTATSSASRETTPPTRPGW